MATKDGELRFSKVLGDNFTLLQVDGIYNDRLRSILQRNKEISLQNAIIKHIKILVVGHPSVGKTSLVEQLVHYGEEQNPFSNVAKPTNLLDTSTIEFFHYNPPPYDYFNQNSVPPNFETNAPKFTSTRCRIYDFGGEEQFNFVQLLFQASHQAIVLLVINERNQSKKEIIHQIKQYKTLFSGKLIVASTHIDVGEGLLSDEEVIAMGEKYDLVGKTIYKVSNKERMGFHVLMEALEEASKENTVGWSWDSQTLSLALDFQRNKRVIIEKTFFSNELDAKLSILEKSGIIYQFLDKLPQKNYIFPSENFLIHILKDLFGVKLENVATLGEVKGITALEQVKRLLAQSCLEFNKNPENFSKVEDFSNDFEIILSFLESKHFCKEIYFPNETGSNTSILFPSLLNRAPAGEISKIVAQKLGIQSLQANLIQKIIFNFDRVTNLKLNYYIFPRLIVRLWDVKVSRELCWKDCFVVQGDQEVDYYFNQSRLIQNNFVILRKENAEIVVQSFGCCYATINKIIDEVTYLINEYLKLSSASLGNVNEYFDTFLFCANPKCTSQIPVAFTDEIKTSKKLVKKLKRREQCCRRNCEKSQKYSGLERLSNFSDAMRVVTLFDYLEKQESPSIYFKETIRVTKRAILEKIGDFRHFPATKAFEKMTESPRFTKLLIKDFIIHKLLTIESKSMNFKCCKKGESTRGGPASLEKTFIMKIHFNNRGYFADLNEKLLSFEEIVTQTQFKSQNQYKIQQVLFYDYTKSQPKFLAPVHSTFVDSIHLNDFEAIKNKSLFINQMSLMNTHTVIVDIVDNCSGTLDQFTFQPIRHLPELNERLLMFLQVCCGVKELMAKNIVHRDLKMENILFNHHSKWTCISNFGLALLVDDLSNFEFTDEKEAKNWGAPRLLPPEIVCNKAISLDKADVFGLSFVLEQLIVNNLIQSDTFTPFMIEIKQMLEFLLQKMRENYEARFSLEQVITVIEFIMFNQQRFPFLHFKISDGPVDEGTLFDKKEKWILSRLGGNAPFDIFEMFLLQFALNFSPAIVLSWKNVFTDLIFQDYPILFGRS